MINYCFQGKHEKDIKNAQDRRNIAPVLAPTVVQSSVTRSSAEDDDVQCKKLLVWQHRINNLCVNRNLFIFVHGKFFPVPPSLSLTLSRLDRNWCAPIECDTFNIKTWNTSHGETYFTVCHAIAQLHLSVSEARPEEINKIRPIRAIFPSCFSMHFTHVPNNTFATQ